MVTLDRLRDVRERAPMTQGELAKAARMSRATIARLEKGESARPSTVRALALALGVEAKALYGEER